MVQIVSFFLLLFTHNIIVVFMEVQLSLKYRSNDHPALYGLCLVRTAAINTNSQLTSRFFLFIDTLSIT